MFSVSQSLKNNFLITQTIPRSPLYDTFLQFVQYEFPVIAYEGWSYKTLKKDPQVHMEKIVNLVNPHQIDIIFNTPMTFQDKALFSLENEQLVFEKYTQLNQETPYDINKKMKFNETLLGVDKYVDMNIRQVNNDYCKANSIIALTLDFQNDSFPNSLSSNFKTISNQRVKAYQKQELTVMEKKFIFDKDAQAYVKEGEKPNAPIKLVVRQEGKSKLDQMLSNTPTLLALHNFQQFPIQQLSCYYSLINNNQESYFLETSFFNNTPWCIHKENQTIAKFRIYQKQENKDNIVPLLQSILAQGRRLFLQKLDQMIANIKHTETQNNYKHYNNQIYCYVYRDETTQKIKKQEVYFYKYQTQKLIVQLFNILRQKYPQLVMSQVDTKIVINSTRDFDDVQNMLQEALAVFKQMFEEISF